MTKLKFDYRYIKYFQSLNWKYSHDDLGMYFEKSNIKISIMYEGSTFGCYKNRKLDSGYVLLNKQIGLLTDKFVYAWMLGNMV